MSRVIVTVGIPASGKTMWANEYVKLHPGTVITCRDDIRYNFNYPYGNPEVEEWITDRQHTDIECCVREGSDIIVADTNIVERFRKELIEFCLDLGATVEIKTFPCLLSVALMRDGLREKSVGYSTIARFKRMLDNSPYVEDCVIMRDEKFGIDTIDSGYSV